MSSPSDSDKWFYSAQGGLIFAALSAPMVYKLTSDFFGNMLNERGCPSTYGIVVHAIIFTIIIKLMMR
ncbi:MAG: hypothetical protein CMB64_04790 [Euryarchaeota archaeon]|nr:hypothetical protein [Euryarchaeota archaeon]